MSKQLTPQHPDPAPDKFVTCGKLRIDRPGIVRYLTKGRIKQRQAFFDAAPAGQEFGSVDLLNLHFAEWLTLNR